MQIIISWITLAVIAPVAILHLWLHALLPSWRKRPILFYIFCALVWIGSLVLTQPLVIAGAFLFVPSTASDIAGRILMIIGSIGVVWSVLTLGGKRFFMYAVLRPDAVARVRLKRGPFSFVPHPAYFGYLLVALGMIFYTGMLISAFVFFELFALTPIVIWLEERELKERIGEA